jgi:cell division control protein 6
MPNLKSAQGINLAIDAIGQAIESRLDGSKKLFVLALDEFDVIFFDKRNKPSDFVYKMVLLEENLRKKGILASIIAISNNVLSEYELDDRVKSRIGSSEIFFEPYSKSDLLEILKDRAKSAFAKKVDGLVLERCAELGSSEHGDARRAIDLLRVASEIAISKGEALSVSHVDLASDELQKDRAEKIIEGASYHFRLVCAGLARVTLLSGQAMHSTSTIYKQYCKILEKGKKPLTYRRIHDILTEMENTGLVQSQTSSRGRQGYGTQYKLVMPPEMVGNAVSKEWWRGVEKTKLEHESSVRFSNSFGTWGKRSSLSKNLQRMQDDLWKSHVGT